jgi:hypothetical protein
VKLYYPFNFRGQDKLVDAEFLMDFKGNNYNGEDQIKKVLTDRQKFTAEDPKGNGFKEKCFATAFHFRRNAKRGFKEQGCIKSCMAMASSQSMMN